LNAIRKIALRNVMKKSRKAISMHAADLIQLANRLEQAG
jgi:hypothetical protein